MKITYLREAHGRPLSKHFSRDKATGQLESSNYYQQYSEFSSFEESADSIETFYNQLVRHAGQGHAIVKGNFVRPLERERRAGLVDKGTPTQWLCLDFDGIAGTTNPDDLLVPLGMAHVDHIIQYSASNGMKPGLRAHVFMLLTTPVTEPLLKQWMIWLNLTNPVLEANLGLTSTGNAIKWPLDISLAESHRLIYIAPPEFDGVPDPMARQERITLVKRTSPTFDIQASINKADLTTVETLKASTRNELRARAGLRKRKETLKHLPKYNVYVATSPDTATVTGYKEERGFVYLNLNGGDSWGYFHAADNFEVVHNFKGEPAYLTRELLPDYYTECVARRSENAAQASNLSDDSSIKRFYFTERQSGTYYKGLWDPKDDRRELAPAKSREQISDYCIQYGLGDPAFIPEMETIFDPADPSFYRPDDKTINLYRPSLYKQAARAFKGPMPKTVEKLLRHVTGYDEAVFDHFVNWLAVIWQFGVKPKTAWVMHGTTGTGKGVLMEQVLKPLFGPEQALETTAQVLSEQFNGYMLRVQILAVDEMDTDGMPNVHLVAAKLKNWITEDTLTIREMHKGAYPAKNHTGIIIFSNKRNPTLIDYEDRRFNVAPRQEQKLLTVWEPLDFTRLKRELQAFANYLQGYEASIERAGTPLVNRAKEEIQSTTSSSPEDIVRALEHGDFRYFVDLLPSGIGDQSQTVAAQITSHNYLLVLKHIHSRLQGSESADINLSRDDVYAVFEYTLGWNMRPTKFSKTVSKFGLHFHPLRVRDRVVRGFTSTWRATAEDLEVYEGLVTPALTEGVVPLRPQRTREAA